MSDYTPTEIRERIEECKQDLARAEGEDSTLREEIETSLGQLRKTLSCKPGKEKNAIQNLKKKIEKDEAALTDLLDEAEAIRDGGSESEEEDA